MKKIRLILLAVVLVSGLSACVQDEFEDLSKQEIEEVQFTEDDEDETAKPSGNPATGG